MSQIHERFTDEQVMVLFQGHCQGQLARTDLQELLGIGKSRFFALLKAYHQDLDRDFSCQSARQWLCRWTDLLLSTPACTGRWVTVG